MKTSLQTRLGQQLTLTPQLRQAIRLLQLSATELELEINAAVDANPLLERAEDSEAELARQDDESQGNGDAAERIDDNGSREAASEDNGSEAANEVDVAPDFDWGDGRSSHNGPTDFDDDGAGNIPAPMDLHEHLRWQLRLSHLTTHDCAIGEALIESISGDGYLETTLEDIQAALRPEVSASLEEIEAVLHLIQNFDPVGVGARTLCECLSVQLALLSADTPGLALARTIVQLHLDALARHGCNRLAEQLQQTKTDVDCAVALVKSLDPKPGALIGSQQTEFILPDAIAYRQGGVWKVTTAADSQPRLAINRHYQSLIGKNSREDDSYLRTQLQEARWLIKSLETRADTLQRVAAAIVRQQTGFLEHGALAMRPLTLRQVAEELGLHESTISRATTRKYLRTPRGTFEFKYFFSSGIATDSGGDASSTAIQALLRKLIEAENPRAPCSDARLADLLKSEGIPVARRTVAKYRDVMNIPSSNERQRL
jgi:RNA polymerase sigma-54 factor